MSTENLQTKFSGTSITEKTMEEKRQSLPLFRRRDQLLKAIEEHNVLIISGDNSTGKSTQIPQYLHEAGYTKNGKKIGCTTPHHFAAWSIATRVSEEMGVELGHEVGYSTLFENCMSKETVIEYMTDKKLLQDFIDNRKLESYSVLIVDEAHQRTVSSDVLLGLLRNYVESRSDLKLIISGACLSDAEVFSDYFNYPPVFELEGRKYPVEIIYNTERFDHIFLASKVLEIHETEPAGDILVLLPGQEEIELVEVILNKKILDNLELFWGNKKPKSAAQLNVCPIFAIQPSEKQIMMFKHHFRKVILATDIAEAYLMSNGIHYVIDMGLCKMRGYNSVIDRVSLFSCPISKASVIQRADQAGRAGPGKCFRLYPASKYENYMAVDIVPEIKWADLAHVVLILKSLGLQHLMCFDFMEWPPTESLLKAVDLLYALDAVDDAGKITETGRKMVEFRLDPMLSKMILASEEYKCSAEIITIAAMLSVGSPIFDFNMEEKFPANNARMNFYAGNVGDHIALLKVYTSGAEANFSKEWCFENYIQANSMKQARTIRDQLEGTLQKLKIELTSNPNDLEAIKKAITSGFFPQFAKLQNTGNYEIVLNPQTAYLHPSPSPPQVLPRFIIYHEMVSLLDKGHLKQIIEVKPEWLVEIAPHCYKYKDLQVVGVKELPRGQWNAAMY